MIIGFQGADHKVGTTMIAQSVAEYLANYGSGSRVINLVFNESYTNPYVPTNTKMRGIDKYSASRAEGITIDELVSNSYINRNLTIFGGINRRYKTREVLPDVGYNILELCKELYADIVIDFGSTLNYGLSMPGIIGQCDKFYYVLEQNSVSLEEFVDVNTYLKQYGVNVDGYILNKVVPDDIIGTKYVSEMCKIEESNIAEFTYVDNYRRAELERKTFLELGDKRWTKRVRQFTDFITK